MDPCKPLEVQHSHGLHMGQCKHNLRDKGIETSTAEKDLGILTYEKLSISWQYALTLQKSNHILDHIKRIVASRFREVILALCSSETLPGVLCPSQGALA